LGKSCFLLLKEGRTNHQGRKRERGAFEIGNKTERPKRPRRKSKNLKHPYKGGKGKSRVLRKKKEESLRGKRIARRGSSPARIPEKRKKRQQGGDFREERTFMPSIQKWRAARQRRKKMCSSKPGKNKAHRVTRRHSNHGQQTAGEGNQKKANRSSARERKMDAIIHVREAQTNCAGEKDATLLGKKNNNPICTSEKRKRKKKEGKGRREIEKKNMPRKKKGDQTPPETVTRVLIKEKKMIKKLAST